MIIIDLNKGMQEMPVGQEFQLAGMTQKYKVVFDNECNCKNCGFYLEPNTLSEWNCQLLDVGIKTMCGRTERHDKTPVRYETQP